MAINVADDYTCTHNVAEGAGAGAAAVAGVARDCAELAGRVTAAILCGANVDTDVLVRVLKGK